MKSCPRCQTGYPTHFAVCPQDGTPLVDVGEWSPGSVIRGKYRILSKLGQGGMAAVYKALHVSFEELRALKVISSELMGDGLFVKRFKHEAVITRKLQHPNAVRVEDIDEAEDGRPFIVMEYIEGPSLKRLIQEQGALPAPRVCSIIKQVASALDAAHGLGMVHRDIKPDNIVLVDTPGGEQAKVLDFGIAKIKEGRVSATASFTLTGTGVVIGTPQYMSPEQAMGKRGDELDGRSDLYSLGVVMYEMLTGNLPFQADTTMEMILAHLQKTPTPIRTLRPELQIPEAIAGLVMRLLEKKPELRSPSARALIEEIERAEATAASPEATLRAQPRDIYPPRTAEPLEKDLRATSAGAAAPAAPRVSPAPAVPRPLPVPAARAAEPLHEIRGVPKAKSSPWRACASITVAVVAVALGAWYLASRRAADVPETPGTTSSPVARPGEAAQTSPASQGGATRAPVEAQDASPGPARSSPVPSSTAPSSSKPARAKGLPSQPAARRAPGRVIRESGPSLPATDARKVTAAVKLGDFFFRRGEYENALAEYRRALSLDPSNPLLRAKIARARKAKAAEARVLQ
jgi:serine/threonine protein kinase